MKFFLDTNVLVYALHQEAPHHEEVNEFLSECLSQNITCYFLASSLKDVYYILCRHYLKESEARQCIRLLREAFDAVDLSAGIIDGALDSNEPDFEDGLIRSAAEVLQVDAIISYDDAAFKRSFIPKFSAEEALKKTS